MTRKIKTQKIGNCKIGRGLCLIHGYSVSKNVQCPKSNLSKETWKKRYKK